VFTVNGIAYAGTPENHIKDITVTAARPLDDYKLLLRFSTGEKKQYDAKPLLKRAIYRPLKDKAVFNKVKVKYGVPVWNNGEIDIAPETLYKYSVTTALN
jgi:hypothetical protein